MAQWPWQLVDQAKTLVVADSHADQLVAFEVGDDGSLSGRRVWAELEHAPDGICADADGAIWAASVPGQQCVRVGEGGEVLDTVAVDQGCFGCVLGGADGRTLFIAISRTSSPTPQPTSSPASQAGKPIASILSRLCSAITSDTDSR